jgi:hypothetical protein
MAEKEVEINRGTVCSALESEIKGNKMYKDYNILTSSIRAEIRDVFFY